MMELVMTQEEHDALHPGKVCATCPRTIAGQRDIQRRVNRMRLPWWKRLFR
jgi:hypothetical protein